MRRLAAPMAPSEAGDHRGDAELRALRAEVRRLRRRIALLDRVVARLQRTEVWDFSVYQQQPGPEWVAVNRHDLEALYAAASEAGRWQPWNSVIERRPS